MAQAELVKSSIEAGVWQGLIRGRLPETLSVSWLGQQIEGLGRAPKPEEDATLLTLPIPPQMICDGVQTCLIADAADGTLIAAFTLIAGAPLSQDIRAEMGQLRAELDLLKSAFRRLASER